MQKVFTKKDTNPMSWLEFGKILKKLIIKLEKYQKDRAIKFDIIVPILRSGAIPATAIANRLRISRVLPVQVGYLYNQNNEVYHKQLLSIPKILQKISSCPNILICETNTGSGKTAKVTISLIKQKYPRANIYYATVARVYGGPKNFNGAKEYFWGIQTNEFFKATKTEVKKFGLRDKITIFPWETVEYELSCINSDYAWVANKAR